MQNVTHAERAHVRNSTKGEMVLPESGETAPTRSSRVLHAHKRRTLKLNAAKVRIKQREAPPVNFPGNRRERGGGGSSVVGKEAGHVSSA